MEKGIGFLILYLTPSRTVSPLISEPLQILDVIPNYTLGGFFGALYHTNPESNHAPNLFRGGSNFLSKGSFGEFSIIPALTYWKDRKGFYLRPVDPSTRPELIWEKKGYGFSLSEKEGFQGYISLRAIPIIPRLPFRFHLHFLEIKGEGIIFPKILPITKMALSFSSIHIPPSSPLSELPFKGKIFTIIFSLGQVIVEEQKAIKGKIFKELKTGVYGGLIPLSPPLIKGD
jgi:hypothetical protein